jgi:hypothetical protein
MKFRIVFWDVLPCKKLSTNVSEVRAASIIKDEGIPDDGDSVILKYQPKRKINLGRPLKRWKDSVL